MERRKNQRSGIMGAFTNHLPDFMKWWRLKGWDEAIRKLLRYIWSKQDIFHFETVVLFRYGKPDYKLNFPQSVSLTVREIMPGEKIEVPDEIRISPEVERMRFHQGARCYGAFWNGILADFTWSVTGTDFYDLSDRLWIHLGPYECYNFDYRGIRQNRPMAFSRFALMKALVLYSIIKEETRAGSPLNFYSMVGSANKPSQMFHKRYLKAGKIGVLNLRIIFGILKWNIPVDLFAIVSQEDGGSF